MANWLDILLVSLYAIWWPFSKLFKGIVLSIVFLLTPVWRLVSFILLPFIHVAQTICNIITYPFSVQWLDRIEVLDSIYVQREVTLKSSRHYTSFSEQLLL
jgi:hypothetical protein